jgi:hypothetical protein
LANILMRRGGNLEHDVNELVEVDATAAIRVELLHQAAQLVFG